MCDCRILSRRSFLKLGGAACLPLVAGGCDDAPGVVSDEEMRAMGLEAWQEIRRG
ncbi:MAG TPA: twin-arginine translocation signal domain-containing protein [Thermohalobaculum sp.]|nr:twin-arginine translocation signal domain-containing protein [Thermohalobaculum sp.]